MVLSLKIGYRDGPTAANIPAVYFNWTSVICEALQFQCEFIPINSDLGQFFDNGTASGFFGFLLNGTINATIPYLVRTAERLRYLDFPTFGFESYNVFITRRMTENDRKHPSLLAPLSLHSWLVLMASIISISIVLSLKSLQKSYEICFAKFLSSVVKLLLFLTRKNPNIQTDESFAYNLLITVWGFAAVVVIAVYGSGLLPTLLHEPANPAFNSISTLTSCIKVGKCQLTATPNWFLAEMQSAPIGSDFFNLKRAIGNTSIIDAVRMSPASLERISSSPRFLVAGPENRVMMENLNITDCSQFNFIPIDFIVTTSFFFRKGDGLVELFSNAAKKLDVLGIFQAISNKHPAKNQCKMDGGTVSRKFFALPVGFHNLISPFLLILEGWLLGLMGFSFERVLFWYKRRVVVKI